MPIFKFNTKIHLNKYQLREIIERHFVLDDLLPNAMSFPKPFHVIPKKPNNLTIFQGGQEFDPQNVEFDEDVYTKINFAMFGYKYSGWEKK